MLKATTHSIAVNGGDIEYFTFGSGERALIILPGMSVTSVMNSAGAVAATFAEYAAEYTFYCFERRSVMPDGFTIFDMADDTIAAMRALGITGADVFGVSMGGMIAEVVAARAPGLVSKLILASTIARPTPVSVEVMSRWRDYAAFGDVRALNRDFAANVYSREYYEKYERAFALLENRGTPEELRRFAVSAEAIRTFDVYGELDKIKCPVFAVGSRCDSVLSCTGTEEIAAALGCELYMYDGYSHAVYDEAPDFRARVMEFLSK